MSDRAVLFHRTFDRFAGHHLKVWHYFNYVLDEPGYAPQLMLTEESLWDESNPWLAVPGSRDPREPSAARGHLLLLGTGVELRSPGPAHGCTGAGDPLHAEPAARLAGQPSWLQQAIRDLRERAADRATPCRRDVAR